MTSQDVEAIVEELRRRDVKEEQLRRERDEAMERLAMLKAWVRELCDWLRENVRVGRVLGRGEAEMLHDMMDRIDTR